MWTLEGGLNPACPYLNSLLLPKDFQSTVSRKHKVLGWEGPVESLSNLLHKTQHEISLLRD